MDIVELVGEDFTIAGSGRYLKTYEHDSLVLDTERNIFYWNSKNLFGDPYTWLTKVKGYSHTEAKRKIGTPLGRRFNLNRPAVRQVTISRKLLDSFFELGKHYRKYWLEERGYTHSTVDLFRLGYTGTWYTIPIIVDGKLRNFQCRQVNPKRVKYWYRGVGALPFNVDSMKFTNWAVLTEGPVDAIMCVQNGIPAMASSVGAGHFNLGWLNELQSLEVLYAVFDNDAGGLAGLNRVGKALGYFVRGYTFEGFEEGYDVTQFFKDGHTKDDFLKLLQEESKVI